jgi:tetratricopeptide (TPR) repeat protein
MSRKAARTPEAARISRPEARFVAGAVWRAVRALALALLCFAAVSHPASAQPVRGEATLTSPGGYARLLLKFQEEVTTDVVVAGAILVVRFNKQVDLPVDLLADALPSYVGAVRRDPDGTAIRLALTQKVKVNTMTAGERVFIDLLPEKWTGLPPALPAEVVKELSERALAAERALRLQKLADEARKRPPVRVRASVQPTFVRFVFDVPDGVMVSSSLNAEKFTLSFSTALTFDLADAKIAMPANIRSIDQKIEGETSKVDIALIGEVDVHAFREDKSYIVDVALDQAQKSSEDLSRLRLPPAPRDKTAEPALPTSEQIARQARAAEIVPASKPPEVAPPAARTDVKPEAAPVAKPDAAPVAEAAPPPAPEPSPAAESKPASMPAAPVAEMPVAPPPVGKEASPQAAAVADDTAKIVVAAARSSDDFRVTFPFAAPTAAAVFRRANTIWLIFDTDRVLDTEAIRREGGPLIADVAAVDLAKARALRIRLGRPQFAAVTGGERSWTLTLADKTQSLPQPLAVARNMTDPTHGNVSITLPKPGQLHRINDPDVGDLLLVVTAPAPARGFMKRQDFVEFAILDSIHGVVIQPKADDLTAGVSSDVITLGRPGGLILSMATTTPERATAAVRPVFDVNEWRQYQAADFIATRNRLMAATAQATGAARTPARVDLARFYLARGFYAEAKGVLDLALSEMKAGEEDASALMVHAAACALANCPEVALADLASPVISGNLDSQLWKALAYARQGKWPDAREKFKNVEFSITALPLDLQRIVIMEAFRAALEVRDYPGAAARSNDLDVVGVPPEQGPQVALLRGRLAEALGRDQDALAEFAKAAASADRPSAVAAQLASIGLRQKREEISEDEALRELEILSAVWRGDALEVETLERLGRIYVGRGRYMEALAAARAATQLQPNSELARKAQDEASALFERIYNGGKGDELPPVEALAMFYEFRDLTPIGRRGDEMIRRLADRLVAVDLLDQASELLQYQVDHRLEGAARAQVAARLAMVYLMSRKPERAIAALRATRIADLAGELRQQRLLLEARAQSDVGRHDLALDIISNIGGREAVRLRSDIYWGARRWRESAEQIELLYGDRWRDFQPLTALEKGDVIRATIGYALAEDAIGLARFREKYGPKMDSESDRAAFDVAAKPAAADSADFARIAKMAATIDTLDGFLREMKARFPDAMARAKLPPEIKTDPNPTGALPAIVGTKRARAAR